MHAPPRPRGPCNECDRAREVVTDEPTAAAGTRIPETFLEREGHEALTIVLLLQGEHRLFARVGHLVPAFIEPAVALQDEGALRDQPFRRLLLALWADADRLRGDFLILFPGVFAQGARAFVFIGHLSEGPLLSRLMPILRVQPRMDRVHGFRCARYRWLRCAENEKVSGRNASSEELSMRPWLCVVLHSSIPGPPGAADP